MDINMEDVKQLLIDMRSMLWIVYEDAVDRSDSDMGTIVTKLINDIDIILKP